MKIRKYRHLFFVISITLTCCTQANSEDKNNLSNNQRSSTMNQETCRNLHKVSDVDDLLKQLYDNIDSYCLFDMPTEELESIWGVKVFDFSNVDNISESRALVEEYHVYNRNNDTFFITKQKNENSVYLMISPTEVYVNKTNGIWLGNMGLGKFPADLPAPSKIHRMPHEVSLPNVSSDFKPRPSPKNSVYDTWSFYYWWQGELEMSKPFLVIETGMDNVPASPVLYQNGYNYNFLEQLYK